jgi:tripartite motif-containing protein 71
MGAIRTTAAVVLFMVGSVVMVIGMQACVQSSVSGSVPIGPGLTIVLGVIIAVLAPAVARSPGLFSAPCALALDAQGNVYVADSGNHRIQKLSPTGQPLSRWGSKGSGRGQLATPLGVAIDAQGNIYVADSGNHRIQKLSSSGQPLAEWGSRGSGPGQFTVPVGVAVDAQGNIYVADAGNSRIQQLSPTGEPLAQWGTFAAHSGQPLGSASFAEQYLARQGLTFPTSVAIDTHGRVYVAQRDHRVQKLSPTGQVLAEWGTGSSGSEPGQFDGPKGVAVDAQGNIYVADTGNSRIQLLSPGGHALAQWGTDSRGSEPGQFDRPEGVAVDARGNIYIADTGNSRIQALSPSGQALKEWAQMR